MRRWTLVTFAILVTALAGMAQTQPADVMPPDTQAYQPKFPGDPAHSDSEAAALAYLRTVSRAETEYFKKHASYTTSLATLAGHGSFTRRMVNPHRGDYTVHFHSTGKAYSVEMAPQQVAPDHRSFYVDETGVIRGEDDKPATAKSEPVKK